jgi:hypothetical protein
MQALTELVTHVQKATADATVEVVGATQEATAAATETLVDVVRQVAPRGPVVPFGEAIHDLATAGLTTTHDTVERLLEQQRRFTTRVLDALEPLLVPVPVKAVAGDAKEQKAVKKAS